MLGCVWVTLLHSSASGLLRLKSEDEMCNFYVMYYKSNDGVNLISSSCWAPPPSSLHFPALPPLPVATKPSHEEEGTHSHSDMGHHDHGVTHPQPKPVPSGPTPPAAPLPPREQLPVTTVAPPIPVALPPAVGGLVQAEDWPLNGFPIPTRTLGQIVAVAVDSAGDMHILHRGPVVWNYQ